ncbi:MAG: SMC-Scp complex subunit ScpB [Rhodothermales bacterium]
MASIHEHLESGLQRATEALVFAADTPVPAGEIADVYADVTGEERPSDRQVADAVERLNETYEEADRVFRIELWAEGYRMATVPGVAPFLKLYFSREQDQRLSRSLMETLAIVAYRQPVTKPEIDFVRGVDSGYAVNKLLEKGLIDVVGRSDSLGRPLIYGTTSFFLEQFGLKNVDELPDLREIEDILDDPAFNRERAELLQLQEEGRSGEETSAEDPDQESSTDMAGSEPDAAGSADRESDAPGSTDSQAVADEVVKPVDATRNPPDSQPTGDEQDDMKP